ncbi:MAG: PIN domain-containing protein [Campylobacterales bacterium]|nr:PIN domain-containing protein [Campylobacterales bacterium]
MVYLIDANVIIRFLVGDNAKHLTISKDIFERIEQGGLKAEILDVVLMEVYFVMTKFYKIPKDELLEDLKKIVAMSGIVGDKALLIEVLNILEHKNIDFVDALLCAKKELYGYGILSFDNDVKKC